MNCLAGSVPYCKRRRWKTGLTFGSLGQSYATAGEQGRRCTQASGETAGCSASSLRQSSKPTLTERQSRLRLSRRTQRQLAYPAGRPSGSTTKCSKTASCKPVTTWGNPYLSAQPQSCVPYGTSKQRSGLKRPSGPVFNRAKREVSEMACDNTRRDAS